MLMYILKRGDLCRFVIEQSVIQIEVNKLIGQSGCIFEFKKQLGQR